MRLRKYQASDYREAYELFYNTVHSVNLRDYSQQQVDAWAPQDIDIESWGAPRLQHYAIVAEEDGILIGFGDIDDTGYLDMLYVHKDYQGMGVATMMLDDLEKHARDNSVAAVTTHASITLKPALEKRGYAVVKEQTVERNGQMLANFCMVKKLY